MKLLIDKGVKVNSRDKHQKTPAHYAAQWNSNVEVLKILLANGADINSLDNYSKSPLDYALQNIYFRASEIDV